MKGGRPIASACRGKLVTITLKFGIAKNHVRYTEVRWGNEPRDSGLSFSNMSYDKRVHYG